MLPPDLIQVNPMPGQLKEILETEKAVLEELKKLNETMRELVETLKDK